MTYLTTAETAEMLKIEERDLLSLIEEGKLRAIRIGNNIRIREEELQRLETTCPAGPDPSVKPNAGEPPAGSRLVPTRSGRAVFRVEGSVATGAKIWPGKMRYSITLPQEFMDTLLSRFAGQEAPVGGTFDAPTQASLGEFIQQRLNIKMNPAVYLAALLIDEGYAAAGQRRGYIRFLPKGERRSA